MGQRSRMHSSLETWDDVFCLRGKGTGERALHWDSRWNCVDFSAARDEAERKYILCHLHLHNSFGCVFDGVVFLRPSVPSVTSR